MSTTIAFGNKLREIRRRRKESLAVTAKKLAIDRSTLNKIELGQYLPKVELLNRIFSHFSVEGDSKIELLRLAGIDSEVKLFGDFRGKEETMEQPKTKIQNVNVNLDPVKVPVLFTDAILVSSSENGLVLDATQRVGGNPGQVNVVARLGMSFDHAKKLVSVLNDHLEKNER